MKNSFQYLFILFTLFDCSKSDIKTLPLISWCKFYDSLKSDHGGNIIKSSNGFLMFGQKSWEGIPYLISLNDSFEVNWEKEVHELKEFLSKPLIKKEIGGNDFYIISNKDYYTSSFSKMDELGNVVKIKDIKIGQYISRVSSMTLTHDGCLFTLNYHGIINSTIIIKIDYNGNEKWRREIKDQNYSTTASIIDHTIKDEFVLIGTQESKINNIKSRNFIYKIDKDGNDIFFNVLDANSPNNIRQVEKIDDNNFILLGTNGIDGNISASSKMVFQKININGKVVFSNTYDCSDGLKNQYGITAIAFCKSNDGFYFLVGMTGTENDIFVSKVTSEGTEINRNTFGAQNFFENGSLNGSDNPYTIMPTEDNGCIVTGFSTAYKGYYRIFAMKLDYLGNGSFNKNFSFL